MAQTGKAELSVSFLYPLYIHCISFLYPFYIVCISFLYPGFGGRSVLVYPSLFELPWVIFGTFLPE